MAHLMHVTAKGSTIHSVGGSRSPASYYACVPDGTCAYCEDYAYALDFVTLWERDPVQTERSRKGLLQCGQCVLRT